MGVRGTGFAAAERIAVVLSAGSRASRVVNATATGVFVVRFKSSLSRCMRFTVQAYGSKGSRAQLRNRIAIDCLPGG